MMKNRKGLTLIEIIISITILGIIIVGISPMLVFTTHYNQYNKGEVIAENLANSMMEEIRSMEFMDIGYDDLPSTNLLHGKLKKTQTIQRNSRSFIVDIDIAYESMDAYVPGQNDGDGDIKIVKVRVREENGYFNNNSIKVDTTLETIIARNFEQPFIPGAHIRVWAFKGWENDINSDDYVPMENILVEVKGNSYNDFLRTTYRGSALFLQVPTGDKEVSVNTHGTTWIVDPRKEKVRTVIAENNKTAQEVFFLEVPGRLNIDILGINGEINNPISGEISLNHASYKEKPVDFTLNLTNHPANQQLVVSNIWPFPKEHIHKYTFGININNYFVFGNGIWEKGSNKKWEGYFNSPGETKNLVLYLYRQESPNPSTPRVNSNWLNGSSGVIIQDNTSKINIFEQKINEITYKVIQEAVFEREQQNHPQGPISLSGKQGVFVASKFFFLGESLNISNNSILDMTSNSFSFRKINLEKNNSTIKLKTLNFGSPEIEGFYTLQHSGETILVPKDTPTSITGSSINSDLLQGNKDAFLNSIYANTQYGILEIKEGVYDHNSIALESGVYYFPDGFDFSLSVHKTPQNGGLIKLAGDNTN